MATTSRSRSAREGDSLDSGESRIARSARVRGRVTGDGDLVVEGTIEGDITVRGDLEIADGGRATSTIDANAVTVRGELDGDIRARGVVRIEAGARVRGDISGEAIALEESAELVGRLDASFELPAELAGTGAGGTSRRR